MFPQSRHARMTTADLVSFERRMQELEKRLARVTSAASRTTSGISASVSDATDRLSDTLASALTEISDRFRGGARSVGGEAERLRQGATDLGTQALRRLSVEVEHRPLVLLAVAAGVGLLIGFAASRR
jgi:ElaB/YqjD/DUF883 family membrane-anchored ribosome-binding protein